MDTRQLSKNGPRVSAIGRVSATGSALSNG